MSADSKVIDKKSAIELAATIKEQHTQLNQLKDDLETNKDSLSAISKNLFIEDLGKDIPEVVGNHEYHTPSGTVTVNFKVTGRTPKEINGRPAAEIFREKFGTDTDKLFEIQDELTVTADEIRLRAQACERPDLFSVSLKPLTLDQLKQLVIEHPDYLAVTVTDLKRYGDIYPAYCTKTPTVSFKAGFIEALGKLSDVVKKNVRGLIKAVLPNVVQTAVNCGNRSKKK
jgi:hypothetical protein